jgi:vacuolar-type H+-ATPase subunit I/STV1
MFVLTPSVKMSAESKAKIDSLNANIIKYEDKNKKIDTMISVYNTEIRKIENMISNIKQEKTIIKEFYHETIISIDTFSGSQIDSFFAKRYGGFNP